MSRVYKVIVLPAGVELTNNDSVVTVKDLKENLLVRSQKIMKSVWKVLCFTVQTFK